MRLLWRLDRPGERDRERDLRDLRALGDLDRDLDRDRDRDRRVLRSGDAVTIICSLAVVLLLGLRAGLRRRVLAMVSFGTAE